MTGHGPSDVNRTRVLFGVLLIICMLGMGLRLYELGADSLWLDEIKAARTSRLDFQSLIEFQATQSVHPPLLYAVTHVFMVLFGDSDFVIRLQAALLGSISLLLTYKLGKMLWSRQEGLIGAFILTVSAYHVQYSQEARHYSLMVFLSLLCLIFLFKALQSGQKRMWALFGLCTSLNMYTHYFAFLILPGEVLFAAWAIFHDWLSLRNGPAFAGLGGRELLQSRRPPTAADDPSLHVGAATPHSFARPTPRKQAVSLAAVLAAVGLAYVPWLPFMQQQMAGRFIEFEGVGLGTIPHATFSIDFFREVFGAFSQVDGVPLLLFLALFVLGLASCQFRLIALFGLWIAAPLLFPFVVSSSHFFVYRYAISIVPVYFLGIARGVSVLIDLLAHRLHTLRDHEKSRIALVSVLTISFFGALAVTPLRQYYREEKADWRDAAAYLLENMTPGDIIIADGQVYGGGGDSYRTRSALSYYFMRSGEDMTILPAQRSLVGSIEELPASGIGVWGVLWHTRDLRSAEELTKASRVAHFPQVTIFKAMNQSSGTADQAISLLTTLSLIQPLPQGSIDLQLAMAGLRLREGDSAQALAHAALANEAGETLRDPSAHADALVKIGDLYRDLNEPAEALAAFQRASEMDPQSISARIRLGETYLGLANIEKALSAYGEVLILNPSRKDALERVEQFSQPVGESVPNPIRRSLGMELGLMGYHLYPAQLEPGRIVDLTLWWQALAEMDRDYTAFVHVTATDGRVWKQVNRVILLADRPSSKWSVGEVVKDEYELELPPDAVVGNYNINVGVYYWKTGARLPVWDVHGRRIDGDAVSLTALAAED